MTKRFPLSLLAHAVICASLAVTFLVVGAPGIRQAWRGRFPQIHADHSTDEELFWALEVPDGSRRLRAAFAKLADTRPVAVILPEGRMDKLFLGLVVNYFGWPREVTIVPVTKENAASRLQALDQSALGAIFFCETPPPPGMETPIPIGAGLVMVPIAPRP